MLLLETLVGEGEREGLLLLLLLETLVGEGEREGLLLFLLLETLVGEGEREGLLLFLLLETLVGEGEREGEGLLLPLLLFLLPTEESKSGTSRLLSVEHGASHETGQLSKVSDETTHHLVFLLITCWVVIPFSLIQSHPTALVPPPWLVKTLKM